MDTFVLWVGPSFLSPSLMTFNSYFQYTLCLTSHWVSKGPFFRITSAIFGFAVDRMISNHISS